MLLSKQVRTIVAGRQRDAQTIEFSGAYTLSGKLAYGNLRQATLSRAKKPPSVASTFLGKCASITTVDLRKKLGSWKFFEPNLAEARFDLISHRSIRIMTVGETYVPVAIVVSTKVSCIPKFTKNATCSTWHRNKYGVPRVYMVSLYVSHATSDTLR